MKSNDTITTTVTLPTDLHERIKSIASEEERSMNYTIIKLLEKQLTS
jgi:hypothetical protein